MESEEMALMNLFSGQQWKSIYREQTYGQGGSRGGKRRDVWREKHGNLQYHMQNR